MEKFSDFPAATVMKSADIIPKSETNTPSAGYTSKGITWANFVIAIKALLSYVIGDTGVSVVGNVPVFNSVDALHIIDSGQPLPGLYKRNLIIGANYNTVFNADTLVAMISVKNTNGTPSIKIGTTLHGEEILPLSPITTKIFLPNMNIDSDNTPTIYYEISSSDAASTARIRFDYINKFMA
jgi:hypothetical protein